MGECFLLQDFIWNIYFQSVKTVCVCVQSLSCVWLFANPWGIARQAPLSMGFSRQEYWSGLPFPTLGDLPDPDKPLSPSLQVVSLPLTHLGFPLVTTEIDSVEIFIECLNLPGCVFRSCSKYISPVLSVSVLLRDFSVYSTSRIL